MRVCRDCVSQRSRSILRLTKVFDMCVSGHFQVIASKQCTKR